MARAVPSCEPQQGVPGDAAQSAGALWPALDGSQKVITLLTESRGSHLLRRGAVPSCEPQQGAPGDAAQPAGAPVLALCWMALQAGIPEHAAHKALSVIASPASLSRCVRSPAAVCGKGPSQRVMQHVTCPHACQD